MPKIADRLARILFLLAALVLAAGCGSGSDDDDSSGGNTNVTEEFKQDACNQVGLAKIANGFACRLGEDPASSALVQLEIFEASGAVGTCTGLVVENRTVLTAAHCMQGVVAAIGINTFAGSYSATSIAVHPGFQRRDGVLFNDFALVFTGQNINTAKAALLLSRAPQVGEEVYMAGYGETSQGSGPVDVLHAGAAVVDRVSNEHVWVRFEGNQSHPCGGDSGGPLFVKLGDGNLAVAGLVSQSDPSVPVETICKPGDYTIYGNVQAQSVLDFLGANAPNIPVK